MISTLLAFICFCLSPRLPAETNTFYEGSWRNHGPISKIALCIYIYYWILILFILLSSLLLRLIRESTNALSKELSQTLESKTIKIWATNARLNRKKSYSSSSDYLRPAFFTFDNFACSFHISEVISEKLLRKFIEISNYLGYGQTDFSFLQFGHIGT